MKKLLLFSFVVLAEIQILLSQTEAPVKKGYLLTGGSISFSYDKQKNHDPDVGTLPGSTTTTDIKFFESDLYIGYFVFNHFAIGLKTDFQNITRKYTTDQVTVNILSNDISLGPLVRYYTKSRIFLEGSAEIGILHNKFQNNDEKWKSYLLSAGVGYSIFVSGNFAIEPSIKYEYLYKPDYVIEGGKEITNGLKLAIGLQVYINTRSDQ